MDEDSILIHYEFLVITENQFDLLVTRIEFIELSGSFIFGINWLSIDLWSMFPIWDIEHAENICEKLTFHKDIHEWQCCMSMLHFISCSNCNVLGSPSLGRIALIHQVGRWPTCWVLHDGVADVCNALPVLCCVGPAAADPASGRGLRPAAPPPGASSAWRLGDTAPPPPVDTSSAGSASLSGATPR